MQRDAIPPLESSRRDVRKLGHHSHALQGRYGSAAQHPGPKDANRSGLAFRSTTRKPTQLAKHPAPNHPFQIETSGGSAYDNGLVHVALDGTQTTGSSAQGKTSGTLYWQVPANISGNYAYVCTVHSSMAGTIVVKQLSAI